MAAASGRGAAGSAAGAGGDAGVGAEKSGETHEER
jgi:hypothetical protein